MKFRVVKLSLVSEFLMEGRIANVTIGAEHQHVRRLLGIPASLTERDEYTFNEHFSDLHLTFDKDYGGKTRLIEMRVEKSTKAFGGRYIPFRGSGELKLRGNGLQFGLSIDHVEKLIRSLGLIMKGIERKDHDAEIDYKCLKVGCGLLSFERESITNPDTLFRLNAIIVRADETGATTELKPLNF